MKRQMGMAAAIWKTEILDADAPFLLYSQTSNET
jgi:hypothetical protein